MLGYALIANPRTTDKLLKAAGYLAGLGEMDVRELSQTRVPVWAVALVAAVAGVAGGLYIARKLPAEWVLGKRAPER